MADGLNIFSLNVNGLRNKSTRKSAFSLFKRNKYDIICLQETYITESVKDEWMREWKNGFIYRAGTTQSCGEIILFSDKVNDISVLASSERFLAAGFKIKNKQCVVINVYAPNVNADKERFFNQLPDKIKNFNCEDIILCGDFNCVLSNEKDNIAGENHNLDTIKKFNDLVTSCNLYDTWRLLNPENKEYTWSRKNRLNGFTARRLDYIFTSESIIDRVTDCRIISVPFSDHRGSLLRIKDSDILRGKGYWKFNNSLLYDREYLDTMNTYLRQYQSEHEDPQIDLEVLKIRIKELTMEYSKSKACRKRNETLLLYNKLNDIDKILSVQPQCIESLRIRDQIKLKLEVIEKEKHRAAQVRSRAKWVEEGERSNKYFLGLEKIRAKSKIMEQVKDENGNIIDEQSKIHDRQRKYFARLYSKTIQEDDMENKIDDFIQGCDIPKLSAEQQLFCEAPLTENELLSALKSLNNGSSPGSDGITVEFMKMFWNDLKGFVYNSFKDALEKGSLSISQRKAIITLIHKGKDLPRDELNNWRPISLTNTDYKIFAKCLAIRMKRVVNDLIHPDQVGYLKGRQVSSVLRLIDDAIEQSDIQNNPGLIATIDMFHAFDCISKEFMIKTFKKFGFGPNFINFISVLMKDTVSSVNYAGWLSSYFPVETGIRQGCPASPLVFILALELLAIKLRNCKDIKGLSFSTGIDRNQLEAIKTALYADDLTLFLKNETELTKALQIMSSFSNVSGLTLNVSKCEAMWIGSSKHRQDSFCNFKWKKKIKILGTYFSNDRSASNIEENYKERIAKIKRLIASWEKRNLSIMGKIIVVKTFLLSQLIYFMQAFVIPDKVLTEINRILFRFVWKKRDNNKKAFEKVKRTVLCADYDQGGLKMIDIKQMQTSFLLQWVARLTSGNIKDKSILIPRLLFLPHGPNFECFHANVNSKVFKGLTEIKSQFWSTVLTTWLNNNDIIITNENPNPMLWNNKQFVYGNNVLYFKEWAEKGIVSISDIIHENRLLSFQNICELVGQSARRLLEYNIIQSVINKYIADGTLERRQQGVLGKTPTFCGKKTNEAKRFRELIITSRKNQPCAVNFWKRKFDYDVKTSDWIVSFESTTETRLRVLQWKLLHNIYPTNILLSKMRVTENNFCSYCSETIDYIEHFFYFCPVIRQFWKHVELYILGIIGKHIHLCITDALFGIHKHTELTPTQLKLTNHIILVSKMCISIYKKTKSTAPIFDIFDRHCALRNIDRNHSTQFQ